MRAAWPAADDFAPRRMHSWSNNTVVCGASNDGNAAESLSSRSRRGVVVCNRLPTISNSVNTTRSPGPDPTNVPDATPSIAPLVMLGACASLPAASLSAPSLDAALAAGVGTHLMPAARQRSTAGSRGS